MAQQVTVTVKLQDWVSGQLALMGKNFFKFRDNIATTFGSVAINSIARMFRWIARLRTGIFILMTVLAVRPVVRFFDEAIDKSAVATNAFKDLEDNWNAMKATLVEALLPALIKVREAVMKVVLSIGIWVGTHIDGIITMVTGLTLLANTLKVIAEMILALPRSFMQLARLATASWKEIEQAALSFAIFFEDLWYKAQIDIQATFRQVYSGWVWLKTKLGMMSEQEADWLPMPDFWDVRHAAWVDDAKKKISELGGEVANLERDMENFGNVIGDSLDWDVTKMPQALLDIFEKLKLVAPQLTEKLKEFYASVDSGAKKAQNTWEAMRDGLLKTELAWRESAVRMGEDMRKALEAGISDELVEIMEWRFNTMKDVVVKFLRAIERAIADYISREVTKKLVEGVVAPIGNAIIGSILGAIGGGGGSTGYIEGLSGTQVPVGQKGGVFNSPAVIGEAGPEAAVPLPDGKRIPVDLRGSAGTVVNITMAPQVIDGPSFSTWLKKEQNTIRGIMVEAARGADMNVRKAFNIG